MKRREPRKNHIQQSIRKSKLNSTVPRLTLSRKRKFLQEKTIPCTCPASKKLPLMLNWVSSKPKRDLTTKRKKLNFKNSKDSKNNKKRKNFRKSTQWKSLKKVSELTPKLNFWPNTFTISIQKKINSRRINVMTWLLCIFSTLTKSKKMICKPSNTSWKSTIRS